MDPPKVVLLTVEYDGTDYVGWQVQPNGASVQAVLEDALEKLQGERLRTMGAGRTDSGVHALGQRASFTPSRILPLRAYTAGLNGLLPPDVAVRAVELRPAGFDARRNARGKHYRYQIVRTNLRAPLSHRFAWQIFPRLDVAAMRAACQAFLGKHDFAAFRAAHCQAKTTVREIRRLELREGEAGELVIDIEATAFLKHMVRNIVGTLAEVGMGKRSASSVGQTLASRDRTRAGRTAPPQGLTLISVNYPPAD
jgi:tRNA pseudouridine38-40 synthase